MTEKNDTTQVVDKFPCSIREVEHAWIPLADGTRLAVRYWLPDDAETAPVPAILEYIPYCKRDGTAPRDEAMHPYFAGHGYAALRVDMRGSGESEGVLRDEYLKQEHDDALEVIAWIAEQPWCSGRVGMMGKSWGGFNGLQVAARRPPALEAVITVYSTDDRYADDIHTMGGCQLIENPNWGFTMFGYTARPADPLLVGDGWRDMWMQRLEVVRPWIIDWLHHQRRDDFWKHGSVCEDYSAIQCPVMAVGGWADPYTNPVPRLLANLSVPAKALVGPWGHQYPHQAYPGPKVGFLQEALCWWDHWLKDADNGVMDEPAYRVWMHDSTRPQVHYEKRPGHWVAEPGWPSPNIEPRTFHLNADGLGDVAGPGTALSVASPQTVGLGSLFWGNDGAGAPENPGDQRADDALSLCFDTPPLDAPLAFLGAPVVDIDVASDQPTALVAVRLCEVLPDGASLQVSYGVLNLTHDESHETTTPLEPGQRYRVRVQLNDNAHTFAAGSRIRIAVSTGLWPIIWPSPRPVTLTVGTAASTLELPVRAPRPEDADLPPLPPAEMSRVHPRTVLQTTDTPIARVEHDIAANEVTIVHEEKGNRVRIDAHGWEMGGRVWRRYVLRPDDPTSARVELHEVREYGRDGGFDVRIETDQTMSCDEENFHIEAHLRVYEDGQPVFVRSWLEAIPRDGV